MALRHYLLVFSILLIVTLGNAFNMKYVMNRLNAIEARFDAENQRRRSEMEALERKFETENHLRRSEKDILEKKFETENQLRRLETDDLERKCETENQLRRSETDALDRKFETEKNLSRLEVLELFRIISQLIGDEMLNKTEDEFPGETSTPMQLLTTLSPSLDKYKQSQRVPDHRNFHSYLILGAKLEKQENVNTRTALTNIGEKLGKDNAIFRSTIINEIRNFTHDITKKQNLLVNETRESLSSFKSDVEASILELSNSIYKVNQTSVERIEDCFNFSRSLSEQTASALSKMIDETRLNLTSFQSDVESSIYKLSNDLQTVSQTTMKKFELSKNVNYSLTIVTNELLNNLSAFVTTTQSELRNETGQSMISLKYDVEMSIRNLSNDLHTVNQTAIKSIERCNIVIDSLANVTNERLNNLSAFVTETQSELRNESTQSLISLKSDVEKYIQKLSKDFHSMNQSAIENDERFYNVIHSLANLTNERLKNLSAFVTETQSELRNESRQSLILFKFDVETTIQKLSNDYQSLNFTAMENVERCHNVSDSLTIVTNERLNNLHAFVTKAQSGLRNESRLSLISLKSDFKMSIQKVSNDLHTVNQTTINNVERFDSLTYSNNEHLNNLVAFVTSTQSELRNETRQSLNLLKSDFDTSIEKLSNDFLSVNVTAIKNIESCKNVSDSLTIVTNERLNNLNAFVNTTQSELRNETRLSLISLKSDVETSIQKLSYDLHTVNQTSMENVERFNNVSDSLTIVTSERLNNLSAFMTEIQLELRNESRQSLISLKTDVEMSIKEISNDLHTVNFIAMKNIERSNNVIDSLANVTNQRFDNLSAFVTKAYSELKNESRLALISFKSDVETSIQKLYNDFHTVNVTAMENVEQCHNVSYSLKIVAYERLKSLSAFVTTTQSELRNETRQFLISLKSGVETSIQKLSYDLHIVNQTGMENVERFNNVSDSLTIVTNERLNNLSASMTEIQLELRNESRQSLISLKTDVVRSIKEISNDLHTVNFIAMKNVERSYNVIDSLANVTNERFNNLSAYVTRAYSELKNESRLSLISFKSDVETSIQNLSNDFYTVNQTAMKNVERSNNVIESLANVTNERFNYLSAFVTKAYSELTNESRLSLISFKSDVETSIQKLSNDFYTVNQTTMKNFERCNNVSDFLKIVTYERFNNLSSLITKIQLELSNETRQSVITLKSDVETSIQKHSNEIRTMNQTAMKILESCNSVSESLKITTTTALSQVRNETRLSLSLFKSDVQASIQELSNELRSLNKTLTSNTTYTSHCKNAPKSNGIYYMLYLKSATPLRVYCDQQTDGGGWLVIQRRKDGSVDFYRNWTDYKTGFGDIDNEFWIGNDNLHALTSSGLNELRIDMMDFEGNKAFAKYSNFKVHPESDLYKLEVGGYSGNATDSLAVHHNGSPFSTKDRNNDHRHGSCSESWRGAWWYNNCVNANLNGPYHHHSNLGYNGIFWYYWKNSYYSLKTVEMKIR